MLKRKWEQISSTTQSGDEISAKKTFETLHTYKKNKKQKIFKELYSNEFRRKTVYSEDKLDKYFVTSFSGAFQNACENEDNRSLKNYGLNRQFYIEMAVAGGNIYRLLAGKSHPKYYSLLSDNKKKYYRASKGIKFPIEGHDLFEDAPSAETLNELLSTHFKSDTNEKIIVGSITQIIFSYLLGDNDVKNILKINDKNIMRIVRFDPEFTFHEYFFYNELEETLIELSFISDPNLTSKKCVDYLEGKYSYSNWRGFFHDFFAYAEVYFGEDSIEEEEFFSKKIFFTPWRRFEVFAALSRIVETSFEAFEKIIDDEISPEFKSQKQVLKSTLALRLKLFKEAAFMLDGFKEFYQEYTTKGSYIHDFWHNIWEGEYEKKKSHIKESYKCFALNYGKDETPESLNEKMLHEESKLQTNRFDPRIFNKYYKEIDVEEEIQGEEKSMNWKMKS